MLGGFLVAHTVSKRLLFYKLSMGRQACVCRRHYKIRKQCEIGVRTKTKWVSLRFHKHSVNYVLMVWVCVLGRIHAVDQTLVALWIQKNRSHASVKILTLRSHVSLMAKNALSWISADVLRRTYAVTLVSLIVLIASGVQSHFGCSFFRQLHIRLQLRRQSTRNIERPQFRPSKPTSQTKIQKDLELYVACFVLLVFVVCKTHDTFSTEWKESAQSVSTWSRDYLTFNSKTVPTILTGNTKGFLF